MIKTNAMLKQIDFKKMIPDLVSVIAFILITFIFFQPLFDGKELKQSDIKNHKGMSKEIVDFRDNHNGEEPLWTNSMFGGMPAYQISVYYGTNFLSYIDRTVFSLGLPRPSNYLFLYMIGFFILLRTLKVDQWVSLIGALAFAFSSYFIIILEAGHNSKAHAIGYMAPTLAFIILTYRGKYLAGGILTALFFGLELYANHPQITYYLTLIILILVITEFIKALKVKNIVGFFKASGVLIVAALLALSTNLGNILTTLEYSPYTIRGKAELTFDQHDKSTSGLDKGYATQWSYGKGETFSLLIPNAKGGASGYIQNHKDALEKIDRQLQPTVGRQNVYWGDQPFTSGPVYVGALIVFLFILGLFIVKSELRWILLAATILSIMLGWGKNLMWFTDFFLDHFPAYNKFRAVSMILVIAQLTMALLAILAISEIVKKPEIIKEKSKEFFIALGLTAGLSFLFYLLPTTFFSFLSQAEIDQLAKLKLDDPANAQNYQLVFGGMETVRIAIFKSDALRSALIILLGAAAIYLFGIKKISKSILLPVLGLIIAIDIMVVDKRYLTDDNYERARKNSAQYTPTHADLQILQDKDPNFRVFNLTVSPFQDASTSFFHKSIGGYHGAKFRRYQDLIDYHLSKFNLEVINMLNTKYFIQKGQDGQPFARPNYSALGNAWFVNKITWVKNPNEEISHLGKILKIENLDPSQSFDVYGRPLKDIDTIMLTAPIGIIDKISKSSVEDIDLSRLNLQEGVSYVLGYNLIDTTENFINLSELKNTNSVAAQQFRVTVISSFDARNEAVVDEKFEEELKDLNGESSASGSIKLMSYAPNDLVYEAKTDKKSLAVFSEIYYPKGWQAYIDNEKVDHIRVDYVLRGLIIPAGTHKIEFKFHPSTYYWSTKVGFISSLLVLLLIIYLGYLGFKSLSKEEKKTA